MDKIFTPLLYHRNLRISLIDSLFIQSIFFLFTQDWFTLRNVLVRSSGTFVPRLPRKFHERERDLKLRIIHERCCKEKETTVINVTTLFHTAFFHPAQNCKHNPPPRFSKESPPWRNRSHHVKSSRDSREIIPIPWRTDHWAVAPPPQPPLSTLRDFNWTISNEDKSSKGLFASSC